jgi:hypothetical protein
MGAIWFVVYPVWVREDVNVDVATEVVTDVETMGESVSLTVTSASSTQVPS